MVVGAAFAPSPASAQLPQTAQVVRNNATHLCLAMDYANAYAVDCGIAGIEFWTISLPNGAFLLQAINTQLCLSNFDYYNVYPAQCDVDTAGQKWALHSDGSLFNEGTGNYLTNDYGSHLALVSWVSPTWSISTDRLDYDTGIYIQSFSNRCVFTDYLHAYMADCQLLGGDFYAIPLPNGYWMLQRTGTGLCLSNFDFFNVYPTTCNIYSKGQMWDRAPSGDVYNLGTGKYLANDSGDHLALVSYAYLWQRN